MTWMLYGATGYTGRLLLEAAIQRGHRPLIAGRSADKLMALAERYDVGYRVFDVHQADEPIRAAGVDLVLNAAGPFVQTAVPIMEACLKAGAHYLDITGEIPVFEAGFARTAAAQERGVVIMSGVGFDIVPSDCLARYVADQLPGATHLEIAIVMMGDSVSEIPASAGTLKSMLEMAPMGGRVRRGGALLPFDLGGDIQRFPFSGGEQVAAAIPWGDVSTAYHSTGIPNITTYMAFPEPVIGLMRWAGFPVMLLTRSAAVRRWLGAQIDRIAPGPSAALRATGRTQIYARARDRAGQIAQAWLETREGYAFTVDSGLLAVERVLDGQYRGALTPSLAFGPDFVLEIPTTRRLDAL